MGPYRPAGGPDDGGRPGRGGAGAAGQRPDSGGAGLSGAAEEIKLRSRQYAKRQRTWFRRNREAKTLLWGTEPNFAEVLQRSTAYLEEIGI